MSTRSVTPPPVARWPFVLGDILLLVIASVTLFTAGTPPGTVPIIVATVCVAAGIGLLLAPYLLEYEARVRVAEAAARDASDSQSRRMVQTAEQLAHAVSRSQSTEEQAGQALGTLEELAEKLTSQADELAQALTRNSEREHSQMKAEIDQLSRERDQQFAELGAKVDALTTALSEVTNAERKAANANAKAVDGLRAQLAALSAGIESLQSAPRGNAHDTDAAPPAKEPVPIAAQAPIVELPPLEGRSEAAPAPAKEETPKARPRRHIEAQPEPEAPKPKAVAAPVAPAAADFELPLEGMPPPRAPMKMPRKDAVGATSLVATAYIGIGNKLYLRGEGPGLNWERGVPMQFLAIGKWGWTTTEASGPITCRIYRNDETPMLDADMIVANGEKAEVTPRF